MIRSPRTDRQPGTEHGPLAERLGVSSKRGHRGLSSWSLSSQRRARTFVTLLVATLLVGSPVAGRASTYDADRRPPPPERWYGWQTLTADGAAVLLVAVSGMTGAPALVGVAFAGFALVPPAIHVVHHNVGQGFLDLGARAILPIVAAKLAHRRDVCKPGGDRDDCDLGVVGAAALTGLFISLADAATAYEELPYGAQVSSWTPTLVPTSHGFAGGVMGTF